MANTMEEIKVVCGFCGAGFSVSEKEFELGMIDCPTCHEEVEFEDTREQQEVRNTDILEQFEDLNRATHCRLMARGEDGVEFCIKNGIDKSIGDDLLEMVLSGAQQRYPEAVVWYEDEESTSARYHAMMLRELED